MLLLEVCSLESPPGELLLELDDEWCSLVVDGSSTTGAGAASRQVMGTAVIGGMLAASFLAIFIIPALFYMIERLGGTKHAQVNPPLSAPAPEHGD